MMGMKIAYSGRFSRRDLWAVERAASRVLGRGGVLRTTAGFLFATVVVILLAVYAASGGSWSAATQWLFVALIPAALFTFNAIGIYRAYSRDPVVGVPIRGVVSESGFEQSTPQAEMRIAWAEFQKTGASADYLLLETKGRYLYALPRAFFSSAQDFTSASALAQQGVSVPPAASVAASVATPGVMRWRRVWALIAFILATVVLVWFLR